MNQSTVLLIVTGALTVMLVVVFFILYLLVGRMRLLMQTLIASASEPADTSGFDQVLAELSNMIRDRKSGDKLRQTNLDIASALSANDRIQLARLVNLMNALDDKVTDAATHAEVVAVDLAASHSRANETEGPSGAAADAAFKTT